MDEKKDTRISKALKSVPIPGSSNPIASLTNFVRYTLLKEIKIDMEEISRERYEADLIKYEHDSNAEIIHKVENDENIWHIQLNVPYYAITVHSYYHKKKEAKLQACEKMISIMFNDPKIKEFIIEYCKE